MSTAGPRLIHSARQAVAIAMEHPATERVSTAEFTIGPNAGMQGVWLDGELVLVSASWGLVHDKIAELNALIKAEVL